MADRSNKMTCDFSGKPATESFCDSIAGFVQSLGSVTVEEKAQMSFSVNRKFLWLWAYEKTADGTLYLMVVLDRQLEDARFHSVSQVSAHRWNHHVVVKDEAAAESSWLRSLIREGYRFAVK